MILDDAAKAKVDGMTREQLAREWRFAPSGSGFWSGDHGAYALERFKSLGGMSPELSKAMGWEK